MSDLREFIAIELAGDYFAIDIRLVREISRLAGITWVPRAPSYIRGLANLRGQVVLVLDLAVILGHPAIDGASDVELVVLKTNAELRAVRTEGGPSIDIDMGDKPVGLVVDRVADVLRLPASGTQPVPPHTPVSNAKYFDGVVTTGDQLHLILNIKELLARSLSSNGEDSASRGPQRESQHAKSGG